MRGSDEGRDRGRATLVARCAAEREARFEDLEYLLAACESVPEAVRRAGWPSLRAAESTLRRYHHPALPRVTAAYGQQRRALVRGSDGRALTSTDKAVLHAVRAPHEATP